MGLALPLILLYVLHSALALSSAAERSALIDLRSLLGLRGKDWPIKSEPCSWKGVTCGVSGGVSGINVSGLRRTRAGRASPRFAVDALANLTDLVSFNASGFSLPGSIPEWFGQRVSALQVLDLRSAWVDGSIPASLGGLRSLRFLYLSGNNLTGNVPPTFTHSSLSESAFFYDLDQYSLKKKKKNQFN